LAVLARCSEVEVWQEEGSVRISVQLQDVWGTEGYGIKLVTKCKSHPFLKTELLESTDLVMDRNFKTFLIIFRFVF
jgi:hypothetical protein